MRCYLICTIGVCWFFCVPLIDGLRLITFAKDHKIKEFDIRMMKETMTFEAPNFQVGLSGCYATYRYIVVRGHPTLLSCVWVIVVAGNFACGCAG